MKFGDIRNTMPSRKPGLETRQWVSMSAISAVRILPQMSAHDILRNSAHSIVEKCILVCIWFSKCGSVILWSAFAFLFPLTQDPSFSNRKAGVPTYPGKLVPGLYIYIFFIYIYIILWFFTSRQPQADDAGKSSAGASQIFTVAGEPLPLWLSPARRWTSFWVSSPPTC